MCHDPIESDRLVGNVFAQLLRMPANGKGRVPNLRVYIYRIDYQLSADKADGNHHYRTMAKLWDPLDNAEDPFQKAGVEDDILTHTLVFIFDNELSNGQRPILILRILEGLGLRETAGILGRGVSNVEVIQSSEIATLRRNFGLESKIINMKSPPQDTVKGAMD